MQRHDLDKLTFVGKGLSRPECALAHSSGMIFAPDWTGDGGVSAIFPNGEVKRHLAKNWAQVSSDLGLEKPLRPNGICLLEDGSFLLAHLGAERGGIFKLDIEGLVTPYLTHIDGAPLPPSNFVTVDQRGWVWITISTRQTPRALAYRSDVTDGFVVLIKEGEAKIVADGLGYTNECMMHPDGEHLYVNETFNRRLTRFRVTDDGELKERTLVAMFDAGTFPDGLAFDQNGDAWITSIVSNRVLRVTAEGEVSIFIEDVDPDHLAWVEQAWRDHAMGRPHLDKAAGRVLSNISNLAFCGENLDHAVLGCLLDDKLPIAKMPVVGQQPIHWTFDIEPLINELSNTLSV